MNPFRSMDLLQGRKLLSAVLVDGVLTVTGTDAPNEIEVELERSKIEIKIETEHSDDDALELQFNRADVTSIVINALGANDKIEVEDDLTISTRIDGGSGNDTIESGNGADYILGGEGEDVINIRCGDDNVNGGRGDDR